MAAFLRRLHDAGVDLNIGLEDGIGIEGRVGILQKILMLAAEFTIVYN
jgi:hypothetical protein